MVYDCKQANKHTHACAQCSPSSVGLAQAQLCAFHFSVYCLCVTTKQLTEVTLCACVVFVPSLRAHPFTVVSVSIEWAALVNILLDVNLSREPAIFKKIFMFYFWWEEREGEKNTSGHSGQLSMAQRIVIIAFNGCRSCT